MTEIIIGLFLAFILYREHQHAQEVKLLSRAIIAKNIHELNQEETPKTEGEFLPPSKYVFEDQLTDDQFLAGIRQQLNRKTEGDTFKEKIKKIWPISKKTKSGN